MHITGKGRSKKSFHFQHSDDRDQLHLDKMHNIFSGLQFGGFNELVGSKVLALA